MITVAYVNYRYTYTVVLSPVVISLIAKIVYFRSTIIKMAYLVRYTYPLYFVFEYIYQTQPYLLTIKGRKCIIIITRRIDDIKVENRNWMRLVHDFMCTIKDQNIIKFIAMQPFKDLRLLLNLFHKFRNHCFIINTYTSGTDIVTSARVSVMQHLLGKVPPYFYRHAALLCSSLKGDKNQRKQTQLS